MIMRRSTVDVIAFTCPGSFVRDSAGLCSGSCLRTRVRLTGLAIQSPISSAWPNNTLGRKSSRDDG